MKFYVSINNNEVTDNCRCMRQLMVCYYINLISQLENVHKDWHSCTYWLEYCVCVCVYVSLLIIKCR